MPQNTTPATNPDHTTLDGDSSSSLQQALEEIVDATLLVRDHLQKYNTAVRHWSFLKEHPEIVKEYPQSGSVDDAWQGVLRCYEALHSAIRRAERLIEANDYELAEAHHGRTVSGFEIPGVECTCWPRWMLKIAKAVGTVRLGGLGPSVGPDIDEDTLIVRLQNEGEEALRLNDSDFKSVGGSSTPPRKYMTKTTAERIAKEKFETLWRTSNKSQWSREIGCDRRTVPKLKAWGDAERRRHNWKRIATRLTGTVDPHVIQALYTFDSSALSQLSQEDRDRLDTMTDSDRAEFIELLTEQGV